MFRLYHIAASACLISSVPALALAAADGTWNCKANGNIPIALVTISGSDYIFTKTNAGEQPVDDPSNGGGTLSFDGGGIVVLDGPLLPFEAVGYVESNVLYWNNVDGTVMACWPR